MAELTKWETLRLPGTCQTQTDIDEATGELLVEIWGEGPAPEPPPPPPTDKVTGEVVSGRILQYYAGSVPTRVVLRDVKIKAL